MRVSVARIRLYLKEGKKLSDGSNPIMLMCSFNNQRKEISTGYSCVPRYWNKVEQMVRKGYPNYLMINQSIKKLKDDAIAIRDQYEADGEVYTPSMILSPRKVLSAVRNDLKSLIGLYIAEKGLENKTIEKWWIVYRNVVRFYGREVIINEIDESFVRRYGRWMEGEGLSSGSIRSYLGKIGAICHYAIGKGLIKDYPFAQWKYHQDFREGKSELYIHSRSLDIMMELLLDELIERDGNLWHYRDGMIEELMDIHSEIYSHYLYMIGVYLKGLAPVDISMLKKSDIKVRMIKNVSCYAIDGHRSKTGMPYKIRVVQNCLESNVLVRTMLMFNEGGYFLPTLNGYVGKDIKKRVNNLYTYHSDNLVNWFQKCNEEIVRRNVENGDDIPIIDLDCRYYSYRHSYIMKELQKPNCNLLALAQSVGKSSHTLHQYISLLGDVDLI